MSKILVTGATGNVGSRIVRLLVGRGQAVRALTRKGDRARFTPEVEVVTGDYSDPSSLGTVFQGVSRVFLLTVGPQVPQHDAHLIDAAKAARVEQVVKLSILDAPAKATEIQRWHRAGEERLEASGLPFVFLRPSSFASNALGWVGSIKGQGTVYGALGEAALPVIDPEDIAEVAATVLSTPGHAGKAYGLTGPEAITAAQQVAQLGEVLGRPLQYVNLPDAKVRDAMVGNGMPPVYADAMVGLIQTLRGRGRVEPTGDVQAVLGRAPRSFRQWAEAHAAAFR